MRNRQRRRWRPERSLEVLQEEEEEEEEVTQHQEEEVTQHQEGVL